MVFYQSVSGRQPVRDFISRLNEKQRSKIYLQIGLLRDYGLNLPMPYLKKLVGTKKLWELRVSAYRIFLSPVPEKKILLIHMIIKKSNKTPKKDLILVEKRLADFLIDLQGD